MSRASIIPVPRRMPQEADDWFALLRSPDCTPEDRSAFEEWLRSDPARRARFEECERLWNARDRLARNADLVHAAFAEAGLDPAGRPIARKRRPWRGALTLAASLAALAWFVAVEAPEKGAPDTIVTAHGQQRQVALAEGSRVHMNTDTVIAVSVDQKERRVILKRGEAFFDIARDPRRPFVVEVAASEIRVVGTRFNVRETDTSFEVAVTDGVVNVIPDAKGGPADRPKRVQVTRGNRLSYDAENRLVKVAAMDSERTLSWRSGMIQFDRTSLDDAIAELNRYSGKPLVMDDDGLRGIELSGGFRIDDLDAALFALKERFDIDAVKERDRIVLRRSK